VDNLMNSLKKAPVLGALLKFAENRPRLAAWIVLSVGIVVLLLLEARDVGLLAGQWLALIVASVLVAGLCIWIVSWEDRDEEKADAADEQKVTPAK
jgi:K+ transporter